MISAKNYATFKNFKKDLLVVAANVGAKAQVIVEYIINLGSRGFPPRLRGVEEMANRLLADRDASLGKLEPEDSSLTVHDGRT
ncbi:hypothetical protein HOO65_080154 [Ceratocystis lukuohia]|uniref:Uncharacterized protein n=1 Tax=Ceratocystis lukuohia TaxID=2019550 RepID=A0ABR4MAA6_9PEZI